MNDWKRVTLGEICSIEIGGTPSRSEERYWWKSGSDSTPLPWVSISDMKGKVITDTKESITEIGASQSNCKHVPKGTLLMSFKLTIGRLAFAGRDLYTNEAISAIKPIRDICPEFLYYGLQHWNLTEDSDQAVKGVTLNKQKLQEIPCLLPPLPEQKKIAEILSGIDDAMDSLAEQKRKQVMTLQDLLDEHFSKSLQNSSIPLASVLRKSIEYGANASASPLARNGIRFLRITDIAEDGTLNESGAVGVSLTQDEQCKYQVCKGDVLLARTGNTVGKSYLYRESDGDLAFAGYLLRVTPDEGVCLPEYFFLYTQSSIYKKWIADTCRTGAQPNINAKEYGGMLIPRRPISDQQVFVNAAMAIRNSVFTSERKMQKLSHLKQALTFDLLSGRKRVSV